MVGGLWGRAIAGAAALALVACAPAQARSAQCPDPTLLIEDQVTLMCTGRGGFPVRSAATIGGLSSVLPHEAFASSGWPTWARGGYWAPDLEHVGDQYLLYYSARRSDGRHCIGVAVSDSPDGGFVDAGAPLVDDEPAGAIDPALLSVDGQLYLLYKRDGNSVGQGTAILGRSLSPDGLQVVGPPAVLLQGSGIIEGPAPVSLNGITYLIYSKGVYSTPRYAEREAVRAGDPLGPFTRVGAGPLLNGDGHWVGTGGGSLTVDGGQLMLAYNAFAARAPRLRRLLFIRPLELTNGLLLPAGDPLAVPLLG